MDLNFKLIIESFFYIFSNKEEGRLGEFASLTNTHSQHSTI